MCRASIVEKNVSRVYPGLDNTLDRGVSIHHDLRAKCFSAEGLCVQQGFLQQGNFGSHKGIWVAREFCNSHFWHKGIWALTRSQEHGKQNPHESVRKNTEI